MLALRTLSLIFLPWLLLLHLCLAPQVKERLRETGYVNEVGERSSALRRAERTRVRYSSVFIKIGILTVSSAHALPVSGEKMVVLLILLILPLSLCRPR